MVNQTYTNLEIIVIDDGSSEDIKSVVDGFNDARIKYLRHNTNKGLSATRNTGLKIAEGDFITFLDNDDEYLPEKIEKQVKFIIEKGNDIDMVYCGAWREKEGKIRRNVPYISDWNLLV